MEQAEETTTERQAPAITLQNLAALGLALAIDFTDAVPAELLFLMGLPPVAIGYEAAISVVEASYLAYLGVPPSRWLALSGIDLLPIVDVVPWCTLAVLDRRFNVKIPLVTRLFNGAPQPGRPGNRFK